MSLTIMDLGKYIICRENCSLMFIEALAMMGLVENSWVEDCDRKGFQILVVKLYTGDLVKSTCRYVEEVQQSLRIVKVYTAINARNMGFSKINIVDAGEYGFDK
ncbi:MAG: hypothetical protein QXP72_03620 [Desulfurococcaceae archaeon]